MTPRVIGILVATTLAGAALAAHSARLQLVSRPYDVEAVRAAAATIQREIKKPRTEEEALAGPLQFIFESLMRLDDLKDVPDDVLDATVALAGSGTMATDTLVRFGDRAVIALIRSARSPSPPVYAGGPMGVLQTMLQRRTAAALSPESTGRVRAMVRDLLNDRGLGSTELAALGALAVATSDPALRAAAERLTDPAELTSRGIPTTSQAYVISRIRRALDTIPKLSGAPAAEPSSGKPEKRAASR